MKKGSSLIESIVSLFIILICASLLNNIVISSNKSINYRNEKNNSDNISYAIENEIKYNLSFEEIESVLDNNKEVSFNYTKDIMNKLIYTKLTDLEKGNKDRIVIKKISDNKPIDDNYYKFRVCKYNIKIYKDERVIIERDVIKSYWM